MKKKRTRGSNSPSVDVRVILALVQMKLLCQRDAVMLEGHPAARVVMEAIASAVDFDAEDKAQCLGTATTGVEATGIEAEQFGSRRDLFVEQQLENDGAGMLLGGSIVGVDNQVALLDGEVDPVMLGVVPPVATSQTHQAEGLEEQGASRADTVFVSDALVGDDDDSQFGEVLERRNRNLEKVVRTVASHNRSDTRRSLVGEVLLATVFQRNLLAGTGMIIHAHCSTDVVQESASRNDHFSSFAREQLGETADHLTLEVVGGVEHAVSMSHIVLGLR